ncbi:hypothetical protein [Rubinisphaera italica]|uniref:Uncharacterized protein n=1 Tax=Rubinisphaera italica TaxID=2527969 RepID=A0A5C5XB70_9PLAN|nr:hypothetical protein [Rubinisphaera italica]TWT60276.1 hypothetical protein Pan54_09900 [Rubinisphaera italica]
MKRNNYGVATLMDRCGSESKRTVGIARTLESKNASDCSASRGGPIRSQQNGPAAELSMARINVDGEWQPTPERVEAKAPCVAEICSRYIK